MDRIFKRYYVSRSGGEASARMKGKYTSVKVNGNDHEGMGQVKVYRIMPFSEFKTENPRIARGIAGFKEPNLVIEFTNGSRAYVNERVQNGLTPLDTIMETGISF